MRFRVRVQRGAKGNRQAVTLVELLAVIAIIAILLGLASVAIQYGREMSRRAACGSNLRQFGLALAAYENIHRVFPAGMSPYGSLHVTLLPHLEQQELFERIATFRNNHKRGIPLPDLPRVAVFSCTTDQHAATAAAEPSTSYAGCAGTWWDMKNGMDGLFRYWFQLYGEPVGPVSARAVTDGLSATIAMSEILQGDGTGHRLRVNWNMPLSYSFLDLLEIECNKLPDDPEQFGWRGAKDRGRPWSDGNLGITLYNHANTPNRPSCFNGADVVAMVASSGSLHSAGVNCVFADGRVEFLHSEIDRSVWKDYATISQSR